MKTAISGVVPHPGATLPYSELRGLRISPRRVRCAMITYVKLMYLMICNN